MLLAVKLVVSLGIRDWIVVQGSFWVLAVLCLLIWVLATWICSICENEAVISSTAKTVPSVYIHPQRPGQQPVLYTVCPVDKQICL